LEEEGRRLMTHIDLSFSTNPRGPYLNTISEACEYIQRYADNHDIIVRYEFNDQVLWAHPGGDALWLETSAWAALSSGKGCKVHTSDVQPPDHVIRLALAGSLALAGHVMSFRLKHPELFT